MMVIDNDFELKDTLYLKTDADQLPRILTGITVRPTGLMYELCQGVNVSTHYNFEIQREKDFVKI